MGTATVSVDEFQALEQKVLQTVELIRRERDARTAAESERDAAISEVGRLQQQLEHTEAQLSQARTQLEQTSAQHEGMHTEVQALHRERDDVRERITRMLAQMNEL